MQPPIGPKVKSCLRHDSQEECIATWQQSPFRPFSLEQSGPCSDHLPSQLSLTLPIPWVDTQHVEKLRQKHLTGKESIAGLRGIRQRVQCQPTTGLTGDGLKAAFRIVFK